MNKLIQLFLTQGVTDDERASLTQEEREMIADVAFENGYAIIPDPLTLRWFFVRVKSKREVLHTQNMWRRGPRMRPHPRSRKRVLRKPRRRF